MSHELEPPSEMRAIEIHRRIGMVREEMAFWRNVNRAVYRGRQGRLSALEGELRHRLETVKC